MKSSSGEDRPPQEAYLNIELESERRESDDFVLTAPLSKKRIEDFRAEYLTDRQQTSSLETVFRRAAALEENRDWSDQHRVGFNVLLRKGPFVEGSSWAPYRTWQFALALERHLLSRFEDLLRTSSEGQNWPNIHRDWDDILSTSDSMFQTIQSGPNQQAALVIAGALSTDWLVELSKQPVKPYYDLPSDLNRTSILGSYRDRLILRIDEAATPALYAVDVNRFARLARFGLPQLEVDDYSEQDARELVINGRVRPSVQQRGRGARDELIRQLRLKVWMRLFESWDLKVLDSRAVASANILDSTQARQIEDASR